MVALIEYLISIATIGVIFSISALGLNLRYGWTGDLDLAYYLFVAIGAYTYSVLTLPPAHLPPPDGYILGLSLPFVVGVLGAMAVCGVSSFLLGLVALRRLRGDYFSIVTVAATLIMYAFFSQYIPLFNGFNGVFGLGQPFNDVLNFAPADYPLFYLGLCAAVLVILYVVIEMLYRSPFGRALRSVREDEVAAAAFGRNVFSLKLKAYVIGGVIAGLAGSLLVNFLTAWSPAAWTPIETFLLYAAIFVGGTANNRGVVVGAFFIFVFIQEVTRFIPVVHIGETALAAARDISIGLLIIAILWFRPQGILPEPRARDREPKQATPMVEADVGRAAG
jgi:ABC-type branched-subunit amino acid transport system permease subunit